MRDILFRGKRTDNGEWIEGYLYRIAEELNPFIMLVNRYAESHKVEAKTVGQFTGLTDKNGTKIFEGDILKNSTGAFTVVWDNDFSSWSVTNEKGFACYNLNTILTDKKRSCEIIGNIHDNPELMELRDKYLGDD